MPIHPNRLREFEEGERNDLHLLSHYPRLTDDDMPSVVASILKKDQNTGGKVDIWLDLGDNRITDVGINLLSTCSHVSFRSVNLGGNPLSDKSVSVLSSLRIQSLDLSGNSISDSSISSILDSGVQEIALRGTKVTEQGILRLLKSQKIRSISIIGEDYSKALAERVENFNEKNKEKKESDPSEMPKIKIPVQGSSAEEKSREKPRNKKAKEERLALISGRVDPLPASHLKGKSVDFSLQAGVKKDRLTYAQVVALSLKKGK